MCRSNVVACSGAACNEDLAVAAFDDRDRFPEILIHFDFCLWRLPASLLLDCTGG